MLRSTTIEELFFFFFPSFLPASMPEGSLSRLFKGSTLSGPSHSLSLSEGRTTSRGRDQDGSWRRPCQPTAFSFAIRGWLKISSTKLYLSLGSMQLLSSLPFLGQFDNYSNRLAITKKRGLGLKSMRLQLDWQHFYPFPFSPRLKPNPLLS